tara:strand:- start:483 stop:788 length:306 start_codon:yes stop_codon:yes gene_type:complete
MRVVKSISLPVDLAQKAESFDNLSLYVQDCIAYGIENNLDAYQRRYKDRLKDLEKAEKLLDDIVDLMTTKRKTLANYDNIIQLLIDADYAYKRVNDSEVRA